jgi:hypothetical protein
MNVTMNVCTDKDKNKKSLHGKSRWRNQTLFCSKGEGVVKNPVAAKEYGDIAADMLKQLKYSFFPFSVLRA